MQFMNTLVGTAATRVGKVLLNQVRKSLTNLTNESKSINNFTNILNHSENSNSASKEIHLADLDLSPEELKMIIKLRELALNQGQGFIEFELKNQNFEMDVETMDIKTT